MERALSGFLPVEALSVLFEAGEIISVTGAVAKEALVFTADTYGITLPGAFRSALFFLPKKLNLALRLSVLINKNTGLIEVAPKDFRISSFPLSLSLLPQSAVEQINTQLNTAIRNAGGKVTSLHVDNGILYLQGAVNSY